MNTKSSLTCHDCQKKVKITQFLDHTTSVHGKPYLCHCYKTFAKPEELMQHIQGHGAHVIYKTSVEARDEKQSKQDSNASRSGITEKPDFNDPNAHERPSKKTKLEDQSDENQRLHEIIKNLKEDNVKLYKEVSELKGLKTDVQNQAQIIKNLREENVKLYEQNVNLKYSK